MAGTLWLRDMAGQNTFINLSVYETGSSTHVELMLLRKLYEHYGNNWSNVPNNSRILMLGNWSPCTQCTGGTIPQFAQDVGAADRAISIKIVFNDYYARGVFTPSAHDGAGHSLWDSAQAADAAYRELGKESGTIYKYLGRHPELGVNMTKMTPVIQIKKYGSGSLTDVAEW